MTELDRTQQRILGVLIEKELAVPDSYPMTENALVNACNQKSNRDPEMGLEPFEVAGALNALMGQDWAKSVSGGRAAKYAHRLSDHYHVGDREKAVLCELLVRGPQAPGALKPRVARLGYHADPAAIEEVLRGMADRSVPMVEQLPKRPRERDHRWRHLLGPMDASHEADAVADREEHAPRATPGRAPDPDLVEWLHRLESEIGELREEIRQLKERDA